MQFRPGDWCIYEMDIVQIKKMEPHVEYSNGIIAGSGRGLAQFFRPLTLENKVIAETMDHYYEKLRDMDGSAGFNFPDICRYFSDLVLDAIDGGDDACRAAYEKAKNFVRLANDCQKVIDGVHLFRPR
jgi:hypothetical protein